MKVMILRFLFRLNVWKSTVIVFVLSLPWFIYLFTIHSEFTASIMWAYTALVYFVLAFILYLFLRMIGILGRSASRRRLVIFTRVYIRFHIAVALHGVAALIIHASFMLNNGAARIITGQLGILAVLALLAVLTTGYLRKRKSSGRRRRYHRYTAYLFFLFVILHLLL